MVNKKAQTAMELAVFGAILIFVIGAIVRQALSAGYMQNQSLRAMRQAMTTSYRYSSGLNGPGPDGTASHQTANILFIEDRLTADSAKYGAIDRTPYVVSASASYSRNLFLLGDCDEKSCDYHDLPVYDMFINGKHFPFRVAQFKKVELARNCAGVSPCPAECKGDCASGSLRMYPGAAFSSLGGPLDPARDWEPDCVTVNGSIQVGCAKLYTIIYNHKSYLEWCTDEPGDPACPVDNLTADERFDLDRSGLPLTNPPDVPAGLDRSRFSWQWYLVSGYDATIDRPDVTLKYPKSGIVLEASDCRDSSCKQPQHDAVDVDGDRKLEQIMGAWEAVHKDVDATTGVIRSFMVMDSQDGDLDFSRGSSDAGPEPGLTKDAKMCARVQDGTYLEIKEGKLYAASKDPACVSGCAGNAACVADCPGDVNRYIRTVQKKDQIDRIERTIQLSNDTDRFCDSNGMVTAADWNVAVPNPVEACNDCFGANFQKTCMDEASKRIYVRSLVVDRRGRKWITNTSGDDYVDFTVPAKP